MSKSEVRQFVLIILFRFVAPCNCNFSSALCLSGERTPVTSLMQWFAACNVAHALSRSTFLFLGCCRVIPPVQFTGRHQRFSYVHQLAFRLPQLTVRVSIV